MAEIIEISDSESSAGSVLDLTSDSPADSVLDLTTDDDARAAGDDARRATPYAFSPQRATTPTPRVAEMKATIRQAGLGILDLYEKSDVVERYAQAQTRLAEAARLKRSSDGLGGGAAPKRPKASARTPPHAAARRRTWHAGAEAPPALPPPYVRSSRICRRRWTSPMVGRSSGAWRAPLEEGFPLKL